MTILSCISFFYVYSVYFGYSIIDKSVEILTYGARDLSDSLLFNRDKKLFKGLESKKCDCSSLNNIQQYLNENLK